MLEAVTQAVRMSSPPKQMLVVTTSSTGTNANLPPPWGGTTDIPPVWIVATHTLPSPSTPRLSK